VEIGNQTKADHPRMHVFPSADVTYFRVQVKFVKIMEELLLCGHVWLHGNYRLWLLDVDMVVAAPVASLRSV